MEHFVRTVNGYTKSSILDVAAALDPPLQPILPILFLIFTTSSITSTMVYMVVSLFDSVLFRVLSDRVFSRVIFRVLSDRVLFIFLNDRVLFRLLNYRVQGSSVIIPSLGSSE